MTPFNWIIYYFDEGNFNAKYGKWQEYPLKSTCFPKVIKKISTTWLLTAYGNHEVIMATVSFNYHWAFRHLMC